jgi:dolichyl-phosphate beta-glucosyltransferase
VLNAYGRWVLFTDADGSTPIAELERLETALRSGGDIAIGSRALPSESTAIHTASHRKIIGRIFNWFVNLMVLPKLADTQCGFKLFSAEAARFLFERQKTDGFGFDVEILFIAQQAGLVIHEIPINWTNAPGSKVNLIKDSLLMFMDIFKARLRHRRVSPKDWQQLRTAQQNSNHENPLAP